MWTGRQSKRLQKIKKNKKKFKRKKSKCESYREIEFMDNVIRLSKFVKNLGIVTTVLFLIIVLVTFVTGNMGVAICFMPFVFLGIALILAYKKQNNCSK